MDNSQYPRWIILRDVQPYDVILIRDQCVMVVSLSDPDMHRVNVSGTMLNKMNYRLSGVLVQVPLDEIVLLINRVTRDRSWTPYTSTKKS